MNIRKLIFALIASIFTLSLNAQILEPVKWKFYTQPIDKDLIDLKIEASIIPKWHLYGQYSEPAGGTPLNFKFSESSNFKLIGKVKESPAPTKEFDDIMNANIQYFSNKAVFTQRIRILSKEDFTVKVEVSGQACDENCVLLDSEHTYNIKGYKGAENVVIPENNNTVKETNKDTVKENTDTLKKDSLIKIADTLRTDSSSLTGEYLFKERPVTTPIIVNKGSVKDINDNASLFWFFLIAFGFGLTALVTPCVFPMIPMTVSFFMHGNKEKKNGKFQALIYGISIVVIYTLPIAIVIGISNILGGESISGDFANWLSTHWLPNIFFFLIFVIFAASFFGMFEIQLPNWMISKSDKNADKGGLLGVFFMAFTLVLVSFSCTGPIVGGILIQSTQGGEFIKPIVGMMGFSLGVALPFTLFAFFPNWLQKLPKSGGWLNSVKVVLGFIELALGLKFLSVADQTYHWGILDREIYLALWIVIFSLMGIYLLGKIKFAHDSDLPFIKVPRLLFIIITFTFVMYLIPGMWGAPLKALSGYLPPKHTMDFDLERMTMGEDKGVLCKKPNYGDKLHLPNGFLGYFDYYQAFQCAKEENKPIFIDFTGHGCVNCREMEANVWSDPEIKHILQEEYVILAMYVDDKEIEVPKEYWFTSVRDKSVKKLLGKQNADIQIVNFNKNSQPYYVLVDCSGNVLAEPRAYDLDIQEFKKFLEDGKKRFESLHLLKHAK